MNKGLKVFLIVIVEIAIIAGSVFVGSVLFDGSKTKCKTEKQEEIIKQDNQNEDNTLTSIQKIYEEAYDLMYEEFMPSIVEMQDMEANDLTFKGRKINKEKLGEYFSEKRLKIILENYGEITYNGERYVTSLDIEDFYPDTEYDPNRTFDPGTIFSATESGKRKLKILSASDEYILAEAEISTTIDGNKYGEEYIIFVKEQNKWKIEFYQ